jgi:hypothetical protein
MRADEIQRVTGVLKRMPSIIRPGWILYACGMVAIILGILLVVPTLSRVRQVVQDPVFVLGAPIVMNGILLLVFGMFLIGFGRIIALLSKISQQMTWSDASASEGRMLVKCPACNQSLRVPAGKKGTLNCPKCGNKFEAQT